MRFVDEVLGLAAIFEPQVNIVVLGRARSTPLALECERAVAQAGFQRLFSVTNGAAPEQTLAAELRGSPALAADVQFWVEAL